MSLCTKYRWTGDSIHKETFFRNLIKSNQSQIVFTISRLISNRTDVRFVLSQSENGKYNLILVSLTGIRSQIICVYLSQRIMRVFNLHMVRLFFALLRVVFCAKVAKENMSMAWWLHYMLFLRLKWLMKSISMAWWQKYVNNVVTVGCAKMLVIGCSRDWIMSAT